MSEYYQIQQAAGLEKQSIVGWECCIWYQTQAGPESTITICLDSHVTYFCCSETSSSIHTYGLCGERRRAHITN